MMRLLVIASFLAAACGTSPSPAAPSGGSEQTARYRLTFDAAWSASTHPQDFPTPAHFSSLVGAAHSATVSFWREGRVASDGIRDMAERGRTSPLDDEIAAAVRAGTADRAVIGGGIGLSPGSVSVEFDVSQRYPFVTFVSMIAPSPDWFVGVGGLSLFEHADWVAERRVDLVPWDAGTDNGVTFNSADAETRPRAPIARILGAPLAPGGLVTPMGHFTFTRLTN